MGGEIIIPKNNDASTNNIHVHLGEERYYNSIKLHLSSLSDKTRWHKTLHLTLQLNPATQHPKKKMTSKSKSENGLKIEIKINLQ